MTSKNLRELLNVNGEYHTFNREERFYAALLYHFLLKPKELRIFLNSINHGYDPDKVRIFFEYAHARDLWAEAKAAARKVSGTSISVLNAELRSAIVSLVDPSESLGLSKLSDREFNAFFGARSETQIQMPGRWSKKSFSKWVTDGGREFAERACTLIWAFNAKADLVIHTGDNQAICIEAKVVSSESTYSAAAGDGAPDFVRTQTDIQRFILNDLLGYKTIFVFLSVNGTAGISSKLAREQSIGLCWEDVFGRMDLTDELPFVRESLKSLAISNLRSK